MASSVRTFVLPLRLQDVLFLVLNSELFGMVSDPDKPVPGPWTQAEHLPLSNGRCVKSRIRAGPSCWYTNRFGTTAAVRAATGRSEQMLGGRDYTVFAGHFHRYVKHVRNDRRYITLATTAAAVACAARRSASSIMLPGSR